MSYGISGDPIAHLVELEEMRSSEALTMLLPEVDTEGEHELRRLMDLCSGKKDVRIHFAAVRTSTPPYMVGVDVNRRYWPRRGNLYVCVHIGTVCNGTLEMTEKDKEDAVWIWLCLAAEA